MVSVSMSAGAARRALEAAKGDDDFVRRYLDGDRQAFQHMQGLLRAAYPDDGSAKAGSATDDSAIGMSAAPAILTGDGDGAAMPQWLLDAGDAGFAPPKSPAHYQLDYAPNVEVDPDFDRQARDWMYKAELPAGWASEVARDYQRRAKSPPSAEAVALEREAVLGRLRRDWGDAIDQKLAHVHDLVRGIGDDRLTETLDRSGLGNNEWLVRQLAILADRKAANSVASSADDVGDGPVARDDEEPPTPISHQVIRGAVPSMQPVYYPDLLGEDPANNWPEIGRMTRGGGPMYGVGGASRSVARGRGSRPGQNARKPSAGSESATRPGLNSTGEYQSDPELGRRALPPVAPHSEAARESGEDSSEPNVTPAHRETLLESFVHRIVEIASGGSRGDAFTQRGNNILIRECLDVLKNEFPNIADEVAHSGGGNVGGDPSESKMKERFLPRPGGGHKGANKADASFEAKGLEGKDEKPLEAHANTASVRKSGRMTSREHRSFDHLLEKVGTQLATWLPKFRPGMDEDDYRELARDACRRIMRNLEKEMDRVKKEMQAKNEEKHDDVDESDESDVDKAE